jgi:DNA polymerase III subunit epsilon
MNWLRNLFGEKLPLEWQWLTAIQAQLPKNNTPIQQVHFAVMDVETTGLDVQKDRILSLGVVPVVGMRIQTSQHWDIRVQQSHFNPASIAIHEITPAQSAQATLSETDMLKGLLEKYGHCIWVGHFGEIDLQFLRSVAKRAGFKLQQPMVDTAKLLARADEAYRDPTAITPKKWQLDAVCKHLNVPEPNAHTAAGDALATAFVLVKLLHRLQKRGVKNLHELI